jgi:hypothetical protein
VEKKKAIMHIDSFSSKDGIMLLSVADFGVREMLRGLVRLCDEKHGGYIKLDLSPPYKSRTTGAGSQNNKFWAVCTAIANETGEDIKEVERDLKIRAISKGYPYHVSKLTGQPVGESMTKIDTVQMSYLIETALEVCAFLGINPEE